MDHQVRQPSQEGEEGVFKIVAVSAVIITVGFTVLAIIVYSVLGSHRSLTDGNPEELAQSAKDTNHKTESEPTGGPVHKNPLCAGTKPCLKEAEEMIFESYPKGKMHPEISACKDMYGHVCTKTFVQSDVNTQPMRFQSLYRIITNIMKFINESVDKDIGYPRDSALVQTMLFIKNCTSQDDRLKVNNQSIFKSVFQKLGMQGFPFVDDTKQPLDVPTATFSYLYIFPFFRVSITHRKLEGSTTDLAYVTLYSEVIKFKIKTKSAKTDTVRLLFLDLKTNFEKYFPRLVNLTDAILEESFSFINHVREMSLSQALDKNVTPLKDMPAVEGWNWVTFLNTMYNDVQTFTNESRVIVKNRAFFDAFVDYVGKSSQNRRGALNYLGFFLLIYLMPLYPEALAKEKQLIGAKVHTPPSMSRRPQICMRRTEFTCPYGIPSLLAHVLANSNSLGDITRNHTWWIDTLKGVMKGFAESVSWLGEAETKLVKEKIASMDISFIIPSSFLNVKQNIKDLKCGYKPDLYLEDPITHFVKAMFTGANASKSELKTMQPRPMIPVISNFEFTANYNPEKNSLYAPMGLFGQVLHAKKVEERIFYIFKSLPDIIREMSKVFMKRSFLSTNKTAWGKTTDAKYTEVERCMFDFYKDTLTDLTFEHVQKSMEDLLESLMAEAMMIRPLQEMYKLIKARISKTDVGFWERGFGRYRELHLFYFFLIESQCESFKPQTVTKEVLIQQGVPGRILLTRSISTVQEFSDAFKCKVTDPMGNSSKFKCSLYEDKASEDQPGILF